MKSILVPILIALVSTSRAYKYDPDWIEYNLNTNQQATDPLDYDGKWENHTYTKSPDNWRFPFYTLFLDRFVNGDPSNDNINGTVFEHDLTSNQMRHGGDLRGLIDTLDYLQGMGIKGIYVAGSPFMNLPWGYDSYSPVDLTLLDQHFGTIKDWQEAINAIHERNMYVILDNTFATMGDLIGFNGFLNTTAPFTLQEHEVMWKTSRRYHDFDFGDGGYNRTCNYPRFWLENGFPVGDEVVRQMVGCYDSEFDQYGDTEAFGVFPDWRRQLSKFASVQDRLRDWHEPVRLKIEKFYCLMIQQLDIDGYRYDKATQATPDALAYANKAMRECAAALGKDNFFLPGEITGGNRFGSIFIGRGRQPDQIPETLTLAATLNSSSEDRYFLREPKLHGLDSGAFHYTTYRTMTRFLGMDGNLEAGFDSPRNWVEQWYDFIRTNDMVNANTGKFDPRHMYGVTNQDVFRWPGVTQGVERQLLGHYITTLALPGIPLLLWGEEQAFYVWDNTATNYIFGRQPMSSATAWKMHGCYSFAVPSTQYYEMPVEAARQGCNDEWNLHDHRDPAHPVRNILKHMFFLRRQYPVLNDGFFMQQLSNQTTEVFLPGSGKVPTELGIWSVMRSGFPNLQTSLTQNPVWLIYSNVNTTTTFDFDCNDNATEFNTTAMVAPFGQGVTVQNLFFPYDQITLEKGPRTVTNTTTVGGCVKQLVLQPYEFRAYVPREQVITKAMPMITKFAPAHEGTTDDGVGYDDFGHDARILASVPRGQKQQLAIEFQFSEEMLSCDSITRSMTFLSRTEDGSTPSVLAGSATCVTISDNASPYIGAIPGKWSYKATLDGVAHGIHQIRLTKPPAKDGSNRTTEAIDNFLFRLGAADNPVIFPLTGNYSTTLVTKGEGNKLVIHHNAPGSDQWRYSTNWGSTFSGWFNYTGEDIEVEQLPWSGTKTQEWDGDHMRVEYYTRLGGSSDHVQQGDVDTSQISRRFPHLFLNGPYNLYGYDAGLNNKMVHTSNSTWEHHFMTEWREDGTLAQINVWGTNPDEKPDQTLVFGDADGDSVLDRLPPSSLSAVVLNITSAPIKPYLGWRFVVNDGNLRFYLVPAGNMWYQVVLYVLLWIVPVLAGVLSVWLYMQSFYHVKFNQIGISEKATFIPMVLKRQFRKARGEEKPHLLSVFKTKSKFIQSTDALANVRRRTVLIATMEYDIEDWQIKIKIGGLGVMAQLMGKNLGHQDLIWVVPCVGGIDYPEDQLAESMSVTILGKPYEVRVQYHVLRNITYVLLDAPVFRQQTKSEPYPPRMDDMSSAIYYSAWNQCIAQTIDRFPIDLYHINDYHGSVAPLYLLPRTIPACLSLHNAEFQGLWPMRTKQEREEVCAVFNLPAKVAQQYVQFGEVFNLLHAGASYLRIHQQGFGAVGVSKKYGKRAYARYPIFWGLKKVGKLPNPDPSDIGEWDKKLPTEADIRVDPAYELSRPESRMQAQEWAGLERNPKAELFVFVGRWSMQKGIDLIADIFPSILEAHPNVQLIAIGPVIDLYGKFAAAKLDRMMQVYPGRVCSKPVFTALPPFIFSGAEFALIPSRDEPFGLVAVEFGRKGALGVGARVGGLGQMPGWWFTVESTTTTHLLHQFRLAIEEALSSKKDTRALMRARSAKQRFPVAQWVEDLEILQTSSIRIHDKVESTRRHSHLEDLPMAYGMHSPGYSSGFGTPTGFGTPPGASTPTTQSRAGSFVGLAQLGQRMKQIGMSKENLAEPTTPVESAARKPSGLSRKASLGSRRGPGHVRARDHHDGEVRGPMPTIGDEDESRVQSMYVDESESDSDSAEYSDGEQVYMGGHRGRGHSPTPSPYLAPTAQYASASDLNLYTPRRDSRPGSSYGSPLSAVSPTFDTALLPPAPAWASNSSKRVSATPSVLSIDTVVGEKTDFSLQKVDPFFTDSTGEFYNLFQDKLEELNGTNSETATCIEEFLVKSEKKWFESFRNAKLGRGIGASSPRPSFTGDRRDSSRAPSMFDEEHDSAHSFQSQNDEFLLGKDYTPPTGTRKWMQLRVGDWPIYSIFMAFGQIIAANSYQITLLTGEVGQSATKLYAIATVYLFSSMIWWLLYRKFKAIVALSVPFIFYGIAFTLIGTAHFAGSTVGRAWVQNIGSASYAVASASGSIFFALNFGDEGGAQVKAWVFRACVIQGTQQAYVVLLWYWGSVLSKRTMDGISTTNDGFANTWQITAVTIPIAVAFWVIAGLMWTGLPKYYRQSPGATPNFYQSLLRRKIVLWFFVTVIVQNFFLSAPYGRNWSFLFASYHVQIWQIVLLIFFFFVVVWAAFLWMFGHYSKSHSWILPLFAIGLGAPRWAQIWWGTSNIGTWLPWAGGYTSSALVSRALWLWLGVLDAIQGVGLGMILLGTLTRVHVAFTLIVAQVLGSIATIVARACAPNRIGPGPISPDISSGLSGMWQPWFWIGLICNLGVCLGYFMFYRKEQLAKP